MILKKGSTGQAVIQWQKFLSEQGYSIGSLDGIFGAKVEVATKAWQAKNGLSADGMVGANSFAKAGIAQPKSSYPPKPSFGSPSAADVQKMFGSFAFAYKKRSDGTIKITDDWASKNIVKVFVPQLVGVPYAPKDGQIYFHKKAVPQLLAAFAEIEQKGLKDRIISWSGSFYPRMVRGSSSRLSNHSWGTAFDINAPENWLNKEPAALGKKGCLLELVPIFNKWGFYWGGHYNSRKDGMHFEAAQIINAPVLDIPQVPAFDPTVSEPVPSDRTNNPVEIPTNSTQDKPAIEPAPTESAGIIDTFSGYAERAGHAGDKVGELSDKFGKVSQSSLFTTIASKVGGWSVLGLGLFEDKLPIIIIGAVIIVAVLLYFHFSKKRASDRVIALGTGSG